MIRLTIIGTLKEESAPAMVGQASGIAEGAEEERKEREREEVVGFLFGCRIVD